MMNSNKIIMSKIKIINGKKSDMNNEYNFIIRIIMNE